jgi:hypothetical protein
VRKPPSKGWERWIALAAGVAALMVGAAWYFSDHGAPPETNATAPTSTLSISTPTEVITEMADPTVTAAITTGTASVSSSTSATGTLAATPSTPARPTATASAPLTAASARLRPASQPGVAKRPTEGSDNPAVLGSSSASAPYDSTTQHTGDKPDNGSRSNDPTRPTASGTPSQACEGRVMFGFLNCMRDQCAKPQNRYHADCDRWRKQENNN